MRKLKKNTWNRYTDDKIVLEYNKNCNIQYQNFEP